MGACASRIFESNSYRGLESGVANVDCEAIYFELDIKGHDLLSHGLDAGFQCTLFPSFALQISLSELH